MARRKFAAVWWVVDDVMEYAEQYDHRISRKEALEMLESRESDIIDAMVSAGWQVIDGAIINIAPADDAEDAEQELR